jgi:hypothetical protein
VSLVGLLRGLSRRFRGNVRPGEDAAARAPESEPTRPPSEARAKCVRKRAPNPVCTYDTEQLAGTRGLLFSLGPSTSVPRVYRRLPPYPNFSVDSGSADGRANP